MIKLIKKLMAKAVSGFGQDYLQTKLSHLQNLQFFHSMYFGIGEHHCEKWKSPDRRFHSDAPVSVVITRNSKVSGVIAFELVPSNPLRGEYTMFVRQLMGAPRANFHDGTTTVEEYILDCTEELARALQVTSLRIISPESVIAYWRTSRGHEYTPEQTELILRSMRKMYGHAAKRGYKNSWFWRLRALTSYRRLV